MSQDSSRDRHAAAPEALAAFVGHWSTDGEVLATAGGPAVPIAGTDRYEWLPGEYALLHTVDVMMGGDRVRLLEVIGWDAARGAFAMHSFHPDGGADTMYASESAGVWTFQGAGARFTGGFGADGGTLSGTWERMDEAAGWVPWMRIRLTRAERAG